MPPINYGRTALSAVRKTLRAHAMLAAVVCSYFLAAAAVANLHGLPYGFAPNLAGYAIALFIPLVFAFCWHAISVMIFVRPDRLTLYLLSSLKPYLAPQRLLFAAPVLLLIPVFASTFTFFKSAIPALNPYTWDAFFTRWDYLLHGGNYPWTLLQPILGYPIVTGGINFLYNLWFFIMYALLTVQAFDTRNPALRMRFLLSFVLSWIVLGTLGAIVFSSLGPCYDTAIAGNTGPYAPLMNYLKETNELVPVWALNVQQMLWENYQNNRVGMGSGISAMPSMHVATAVLMALFGWQYSRAAGIALTFYAMVIFIGSIHLAWHYALDGYAGALGAWLIWWLVGRWQGGGAQATPATT
jgi:hypothetical protein